MPEPVTPPTDDDQTPPEGAQDANQPVVDPDVEDAINAFVGDVKGEVKDNHDPAAPVEEPAEPEEEAPAEEEEQPAVPPKADDKPEADPDHVYEEEPVEDPGEFKAGDYSFVVKTTDGKEHAIKSPEDAETLAELLDEDPGLINASELLRFNRNATKMDVGIDSDRRAYEANKAQFDEAQERVQARETTIATIDSGMAYLEAKGLIPPVAKDINTPEAGAKWGTDYKDEPGVKERLELMAYMADENDRRIAAGLPASFDVTAAYNAIQLEKLQTQGKQEEDAEAEQRRKRGGMVAGQAPTIPEPQGKGKEIVGTGGKLDDLVRDFEA